MIFKRLILGTLFLIVFGVNSGQAACLWEGNTGTASAATPESVQSCVNEITSAFSGQVNIAIPSGTQAWATHVKIDMTDVSNPGPNFTNVTKLDIRGAGIDSTTIMDALSSHGYEVALFFIKVAPGKFIRLGGMTLNGNNASTTNGVLYIKGTGGGQTFRIDGMKFLGYGSGRGIKIDGYTYGLIDNNSFTGGGHSIDTFGDGSDSWLRPAALGTGNAVYIEKNIFDFSVSGMSDGVIDGYSGARYVFRYNTVMGTNIGHHGNDSGNYRSVHTFEIYNNTFTNNTSKNIFTWGNFRGGSGVIFNNVIRAGTSTYNNFVFLQSYRSCPYFEGTHDGGDLAYLSDSKADFSKGSQGALANGHYVYNLTAGSYCKILSHTDSGPATAVCTLSGGTRQTWKNGDYYGIHYIQNNALLCSGKSVGIDGNTGFEGYPCQDQIGRTSNQVLDPIYNWGNNFLGSTTPSMVIGGTCGREAQHIVSGRDYVNNGTTPKPGYSSYTYPHPLSGSDTAPRNLRKIK
jgi:hypothetical protein